MTLRACAFGCPAFFLIALGSVATAQVTEQWMAAYNGPSGSIDSVRTLAVGDDGSVYVAGTSTSSTLSDYTLLKYSPGGLLLWEARFDGPGHFRDDARWMVVDPAGFVYVTGSSRSTVQSGSEGFVTVKYDPNGVQQWAVRYDGPGNSADVAERVAVDDSGNVYVTGQSYGNSMDLATVKYNSAGDQQWVARHDGSGGSLDAPTGLGVDHSGNIFVTGWSRSTSLYGSEDYLTIKYSASGTEQWARRFNGPSNFVDQASSIALDGAGNAYVTGYSVSTTTQADFVTLKYATDGSLQWTATYNDSVNNGSDMARMVVVDGSGNVYVTGSGNTEYPFGYPDFVTIKYSAQGERQWVSRYNGPGGGQDIPQALALDMFGNVYVTGRTSAPGFVFDFATVKYDPDGTRLWEKRFNGPQDLHDGATWVSVDDSGNVYVAGNSMYFSNFASDFVIIKYDQWTLTDVPDGWSQGPAEFRLEQNYPNPFNPTTTLRYSVPVAASVTMTIFNVYGQEVRTLVNGVQEPGYRSVEWDALNGAGSAVASGVYFYRLQAIPTEGAGVSSFSQTRKMVLLR